MAYLKSWAPRALRPLELRLPRLLPRAESGKGLAISLDALAAAQEWGPRVDIAYIDPPYNQHSYLGNYHVWESLVRWDKPDVYGVAMKRVDVRERASVFNRRSAIAQGFREVLDAVRARHLIVSFSDEGYLTVEEVRSMLEARGAVRVAALPHRRYIGSQIGIYNPQGEKVGRPGRRTNREHLFVVETGLVASA
jgi:adenine-specific DNA-methyltransferase